MRVIIFYLRNTLNVFDSDYIHTETLFKEALGKIFVAKHSHLSEECFCGHTKTFKRWPVVGNGGIKHLTGQSRVFLVYLIS